MLISLILICSLAPLASATEITAADLGCQTTYVCYAPESCTDATLTLGESDILNPLKARFKISPNCDAIIRIHQYTLNWIYVSIISFNTPDKTNSIVFKQVNGGVLKNELSCIIDGNGKRAAKYTYTTNNGILKKIHKDGKASDPSNPLLPFECEFSVRRKSEKFFNGVTGDVVTIETSNGADIFASNPTKISLDDELKCDPSAFELSKEEKLPDKKFEPANYFPKKYGCTQKIFTFEFRNKPTEEFKSIEESKLVCEDKPIGSGYKLILDGTPVDESATFRCSADVFYFCDYPVMKMEGDQYTKITQELPDRVNMKKADLKCPGDAPHLVIVNDNSEDLIMNAKFECVNYGSQQLWTVQHQTKNIPIKITKEGPVVYCTKTLKCSLFFTLSEGAVDNGILNNQLLPECHDNTGTLMSEGKEVTGSRCDEGTGQFKYTVGGDEKTMNKDTKFLCKYPVEVHEAQQQEEKNKQKMTTGIIVGIAIATVLFAVGVGILIIYSMYKTKKNKREIEAQIYAEKIQFGSRSVKEAARKAANKLSHGSKKPVSPTDCAEKWKDFVLTSQRFAKMHFSGNEDGVFPTLSTNVTKRRPKDDPTTTKQAATDKKMKTTVDAEKKENYKKACMSFYDSKEAGIDKAYAGRAEKIEKEKNIGKKN